VAALQQALSAGPVPVVHLAVHGVGDRARGRYSGLVMADPPSGSSLVPFDHLARLGLSSDLVVLSGCSTAVAGPLHRDRLAGVTVAAIESGARSVIGCLWPVNDTAAEVFMRAFYTSLRKSWDQGPVDLRTCVAAGRGAVRSWAVSSDGGGAGPARDGTREVPNEVAGESAALDTREAVGLAWAPFVLTGAPVVHVRTT
jgi:hypothetical protein